MKDIYLVRHGETDANVRHAHQHYDEPLNIIGEGQAKLVAEQLAQYEPDTIITSPFARARETAAIISTELGVPYAIATAVHEVRRPTYLYGRSHFSPWTVLYLLQLFWHRSEDGWDDDQAENMFDVRNRIHDTKDMLMEEEGKRIVVVTHSFFISMFIQLVCQENSLSFWHFVKLVFFAKKSPNTTVVHLQYNPDYAPNTCPWVLVSVS